MSDSKQPAFQSDGGAGQLQAQVDEENAQGYRGTAVDQTPNENYTVAGGIATEADTPETDPDLDEQGNATDAARDDEPAK